MTAKTERGTSRKTQIEFLQQLITAVRRIGSDHLEVTNKHSQGRGAAPPTWKIQIGDGGEDPRKL